MCTYKVSSNLKQQFCDRYPFSFERDATIARHSVLDSLFSKFFFFVDNSSSGLSGKKTILGYISLSERLTFCFPYRFNIIIMFRFSSCRISVQFCKPYLYNNHTEFCFLIVPRHKGKKNDKCTKKKDSFFEKKSVSVYPRFEFC